MNKKTKKPTQKMSAENLSASAILSELKSFNSLKHSLPSTRLYAHVPVTENTELSLNQFEQQFTVTDALEINKKISDRDLMVEIKRYELDEKKNLYREILIIKRAAYLASGLEKINKTNFFEYYDQLVQSLDGKITIGPKRTYGWVKKRLLEFTGNEQTLTIEKMDAVFLTNYYEWLINKNLQKRTIKTLFGYMNIVLNHLKEKQGFKSDTRLLQQVWMTSMVFSPKS